MPPFWHWLPARFFLGIKKLKQPVLGMELSGDIEAAGDNVKFFKKGDQIPPRKLRSRPYGQWPLRGGQNFSFGTLRKAKPYRRAQWFDRLTIRLIRCLYSWAKPMSKPCHHFPLENNGRVRRMAGAVNVEPLPLKFSYV